ncbi:hypothetical protein Zmor_013493 [Zophobas morio]|uniref:Uncharacterized protein n=1 Tax=Zophobas morio TaxID=2755281 RepID=A0AA38IHR0_9CUCU|nr:hypothetical protein Zmor_013493 [Zophobas morio]
MEALLELHELYPNYSNPDLPFVVNCAAAIEHGAAVLPFQRILPNIFQIEGVRRLLPPTRPYCMWEVMYSLADGTNLPTGAGLKQLVECLTRFTPLNTAVISSGLQLPKVVIIHYGVICKCDRLNFDFAAETLHLQQNLENLKL